MEVNLRIRAYLDRHLNQASSCHGVRFQEKKVLGIAHWLPRRINVRYLLPRRVIDAIALCSIAEVRLIASITEPRINRTLLG